MPDAPAPAGAAASDGGSNRWILTLMQDLPLALGVIDREGRLAIGNDAMRATVGESWQPGEPTEALAVADDRTQLAAAVERVITSGQSVHVRLALRFRPDELQDISLLPLPHTLGAAALLAMRDIRERLRLEAQVAAATRLQAVGQLAGGVAHDFNNLLTAVLALTDQLLEQHPEGDADHEALQQIRLNGERGATLVGQLLAFARQQPQRQQMLDPRTLIEGLRPLLVQLLGPAVELVIDGSPLAQVVRADPGQLEQVIVNLAVNARDAMSGNGRLTITVETVRAAEIAALGHGIIPRVDHIAIDITDTGTGIPAAIAGKIFEPFFTTKPMGQGTGLGLSTAYGIIKQSEGFIFARPAPGGRGTTFSIYLPARPRPRSVAAPEAPARAEIASSVAGLRLLLVEDDAAVRNVFARGLERSGIAVTTANDAMSALTLLRTEQPFDVLVSDVMMPGIDGVELAQEASRLRPGLGLLLMSGYAELPLHRAADAQGVRFLAKPFALAELVQAIGELKASE